VASKPFGGFFRYGESELDPAIQAEILLESARNEARVAILEIVLALGFALWYRFQGPEVRAVTVFVLLTVLPLILDSQLRRNAARRLLGVGPQPVGRPGGTRR
jgi:ABC-type spermidine/putrescine transport system permease subunit I